MGMPLRAYVAFLERSIHPIGGKEPIAAGVLRACLTENPIPREAYIIAHNVSAHGRITDKRNLCPPECRRGGIRKVVEGTSPGRGWKR